MRTIGARITFYGCEQCQDRPAEIPTAAGPRCRPCADAAGLEPGDCALCVKCQDNPKPFTRLASGIFLCLGCTHGILLGARIVEVLDPPTSDAA